MSTRDTVGRDDHAEGLQAAHPHADGEDGGELHRRAGAAAPGPGAGVRAAERPHGEIAAWLSGQFGIPGWWCQNVTVEYERARGLRPPRGDRDGTHSVSASRTVAVPVERLFAAFVDRWPELRRRTAQPSRSARFDWEDGGTRVNVGFAAKDAAKSTVAVAHERIADAGTAERLKEMWRGRLTELKKELEGDGNP